MSVQRFFFGALLMLVSAMAFAEADKVLLDRVAAIVDDDVITERQLTAELDQITSQLRSQGNQLPPRDVLQRQVLDRMINIRIQLQKARELGIRVDEMTLNNTLQNIARENGMTLSQFRQALAADGLDYDKFRNDIRNEITINQLHQQQIQRRVTVSEKEIDDFLARQEQQKATNQAYRLRHILIAIPEAASPEQISEARAEAETVLQRIRGGEGFANLAIGVSDGQQALEGGDLGWRTAGRLPTLFADAVADMEVGDIKGPIQSPSGFHLIKLIDVRGQEQRHVITETHARHILIKPGELVSDAQARLRISELRQQILEGADFGELARTYSDDPGSAQEGGDLGWVQPGTMVPAFEQAMNDTEAGRISEPFRSRFGWHIVEVLDRRQVDKTEDIQRAQAREAIHQRKADEELDLWLRRLRDQAFVAVPGRE